MVHAPDAIAVVREVYGLSGSLDEWAQRVTQAYTDQLPTGRGAFSVLFRQTNKMDVVETYLAGAHPIHIKLTQLASKLPTSGEVCSRGVGGFARDLYADSGIFALLSKEGLVGLNSLTANGPDEVGGGFAVACPHRTGDMGERERLFAHKLWPHLGAGLRLRKQLAATGGPTVEAVMRPDGRVLDARGPAQDAEARDALRRSVAKMDRSFARTARGETPAENLLDALVEGRWSLVETFESDGRRNVCAYANPPGVLDPRRLTAREREIATGAAKGWTQKRIADDLGVSPAHVCTTLATVVAKLGLRKASQIPTFWRSADGIALPVAGMGDLRVRSTPTTGIADARERLTPAEDQTLDQLLLGKSNEEIARSRGVRYRTVANQVSAVFRKLGVRSRSELAATLADDRDAE